jgi:putative oxidoreductase
MKRKVIVDLSASVLILLFVLTVLDKLVNFQGYREKMTGQVFESHLLEWVIYSIPACEIACILLLLFSGSRPLGFIFSSILMALFTGYVMLVELHVFAKHPCPCGGPIKYLSWSEHLAFNCFFLAVSIFGLVLNFRERRTENLL